MRSGVESAASAAFMAKAKLPPSALASLVKTSAKLAAKAPSKMVLTPQTPQACMAMAEATAQKLKVKSPPPPHDRAASICAATAQDGHCGVSARGSCFGEGIGRAPVQWPSRCGPAT